MAFVEDRDVYFSDFGIPAIYTPTGGVASSITIIFDNEYSAPEGVGIIRVSSSTPVATCKTSDVSEAARGDTLKLVVDGVDVTFKVTEVMPDGMGFTVLRLSKD